MTQKRKPYHSIEYPMKTSAKYFGLVQGSTTFCYCLSHYFYLYEVRPPMSLSYIYEIPPSANIFKQIVYSFYNSLWHDHPDCYASCQLIFLPCVCFASICASTAAKTCILNYMRMATNFIVEGRVWLQVVRRWPSG